MCRRLPSVAVDDDDDDDDDNDDDDDGDGDDDMLCVGVYPAWLLMMMMMA